MTMISNLSRNLIEEILSRVPLKFMREVRLTCKKWNAISKSQSFSKMLVDKEEAAKEEGESQDEVPCIKLKSKLTCLTEQAKAKISQVFYSEGLMLCIYKDVNENNTKLMVCNPYCLQSQWFEPKPRCSYNGLIGVYKSCYGFGYVENKSCGRSHKILRFHVDVSSFRYTLEERLFWYEIYDIESESWRTLDITPLWSTRFHGFGITVKGNTYWCVSKVNAEGFHIICFDFTKERFGKLLHLPNQVEFEDEVILSCVKDEKLAVLLAHEESLDEFEIWITTEIEPEKLTWSKFLTVNMAQEFQFRLGSFIIDEQKKLFIGLDHEEITIIEEGGYFIKLFLKESDNVCGRGYLCGYVPSSQFTTLS